MAVGILLASSGQPACASQTLCTFSGGEAPRYYELEFIGYSSAHPRIAYSATSFDAGRRLMLDPANYSLKQFNARTGKVSLAFRNPKSAAWPPSFKLNGAGGRAILTTGTSAIEGTLTCGL